MNVVLDDLKSVEKVKTQNVEGAKPAESAHEPEEQVSPLSWWILTIAALAAGLVIFFGIRSRLNAAANVAAATREAAISSVEVVHPWQTLHPRRSLSPATRRPISTRPFTREPMVI
jgi:hypothetical protein